jgi:hypothetical protein
MKRRTPGVLLRNNFENSTAVSRVHETVRGEHQTEQIALPSVLNSNDEKKQGVALRTHRYSESSDPPQREHYP